MGFNATRIIIKSGDEVVKVIESEVPVAPVQQVATVEAKPAKKAAELPPPKKNKMVRRDENGKVVFGGVKTPPAADREEYKESVKVRPPRMKRPNIGEEHIVEVNLKNKKATMTKRSAFLLDMLSLDE